LTLWLIQLGASPDLIHDGLRIVKDELAHADLSHRAYLAAGGEGGPTLARESLELTRHGPLEEDVARVCVDVFCLGETVAVRLFKELRARCTVPAARRVLDRVLKDEVRHRDFGWTLLPWLLEAHPQVRGMIERELGTWLKRIRGAYAPENVVDDELSEAETSWGLMPIRVYAEVVQKTFERDYVPRFARLGLDARQQ
jgi:1,2-phenylacetyl-CoA epoxidase catalytic subunit